MSIIQRVQMESLDNHLFYFTLTYQNSELPTLFLENGWRINYADIRDIQNMFKRIRKYDSFGRPFRYFVVSERGGYGARPHFHGIVSLPKYTKDDYNDILNLEKKIYDSVLKNWVRNYGSTRKPDYHNLLRLVHRWQNGILRSTYDCHYISPRYGSDSGASVAFYVLKYMLKEGSHEEKLRQALWHNYEHDEYHEIWQTVKSRHLFSKNFGNSKSVTVQNYIKDCIKYSIDTKQLFPCFVNPDDGKTFPLSKIYKEKFLTYEDALSFYYLNPTNTLDNFQIDDRSSLEILQEYRDTWQKYDENLRLLGQLSIHERQDELYLEDVEDDVNLIIQSHEKDDADNRAVVVPSPSRQLWKSQDFDSGDEQG